MKRVLKKLKSPMFSTVGFRKRAKRFLSLVSAVLASGLTILFGLQIFLAISEGIPSDFKFKIIKVTSSPGLPWIAGMATRGDGKQSVAFAYNLEERVLRVHGLNSKVHYSGARLLETGDLYWLEATQGRHELFRWNLAENGTEELISSFPYSDAKAFIPPHDLFLTKTDRKDRKAGNKIFLQNMRNGDVNSIRLLRDTGETLPNFSLEAVSSDGGFVCTKSWNEQKVMIDIWQLYKDELNSKHLYLEEVVVPSKTIYGTDVTYSVAGVDIECSFSADGQKLLLAPDNNTLKWKIIDLQTGRLERELTGSRVKDAILSNSGEVAVFYGTPQGIYLLNTLDTSVHLLRDLSNTRFKQFGLAKDDSIFLVIGNVVEVLMFDGSGIQHRIEIPDDIEERHGLVFVTVIKLLLAILLLTFLVWRRRAPFSG